MDGRLEAQSEICSLLHKRSQDRERFVEGLEDLAGRYGTEVYPLLFLTAAHLEFSKKSARSHWNEILLHWEWMSRRVRNSIDLRIVILDYFIVVKRRIVNPKIVEIKVFEKTVQETFIDELTRLYNYRYLTQALHREVMRAKRFKTSLSFIMYDVDDFKRYNDANGHLAGNRALKKMAGIIRRSSRDIDIVARYGGEEFAVILPETGKEGAHMIAERTLQKIRKSNFARNGKEPLRKLTLSGGLATLHVDAGSASILIRKADLALYRAKSMGKNRVTAFGRDRRRYVRANGMIINHITVVTEDGDPCVPRNISEGGILFDTGRAMEAGKNLRLSLEFKDSGGTVPFRVSIARVERLADEDRFEVGASIMRNRSRWNDKKLLKDLVNFLAPQ